MNEFKEQSLEKTSKLEKASKEVAGLTEEDLNAPIDEIVNGKIELESCDCRPECKYNTGGDSSKYANYGYSG